MSHLRIHHAEMLVATPFQTKEMTKNGQNIHKIGNIDQKIYKSCEKT